MSWRSGFGFLGLLIVVAIIALLVFGGEFYSNSFKQKESTIQTGIQAEKRAQELKDKIEGRYSQ